MITLKYNTRISFLLLPVLGIILFIILYVVAASLYPGGSQVDTNSIGFSWINNYWCNLLNDNAINGKPNPAKLIALTGMMVLSISLSFFWYFFAKYMKLKKYHRLIMQVSGILSMIVSMFVFTGFHYKIINVAVLLGLIALVVTHMYLYKLKWHGLFTLGIFNMLLVVLNNYVYSQKVFSFTCLLYKRSVLFLFYFGYVVLI